MRDHFFTIMANLANWDGKKESLQQQFADPYKDKNGKNKK